MRYWIKNGSNASQRIPWSTREYGFFSALSTAEGVAVLREITRDIRHGLPFVVQLWMFLTRVIYPVSFLPKAMAMATQSESAKRNHWGIPRRDFWRPIQLGRTRDFNRNRTPVDRDNRTLIRADGKGVR